MHPISSAPYPCVTCLALVLQVNQLKFTTCSILHQVPWNLYPDDGLELITPPRFSEVASTQTYIELPDRLASLQADIAPIYSAVFDLYMRCL